MGGKSRKATSKEVTAENSPQLKKPTSTHRRQTGYVIANPHLDIIWRTCRTSRKRRKVLEELVLVFSHRFLSKGLHLETGILSRFWQQFQRQIKETRKMRAEDLLSQRCFRGALTKWRTTVHLCLTFPTKKTQHSQQTH